MMLVQVLAAALVSENKALSLPGQRRFDPDLGQPRGPRVDEHRRRPARRGLSSPTRRACWPARCCARPRGWSSTGRLRPGRGAEAAYQHVREHVRPLGRDRTLHRDLEAVERLIRSGSLLNAVVEVVGELVLE